MTGLFRSSNLLFFGSFFTIWVVLVVMTHRDYPYFAAAPPGAGVTPRSVGSAQRLEMLNSTVSELKKSLEEEIDSVELPHIRHNLGIAFYDIYKINRQRGLLDSAKIYLSASVESGPPIARFYYNFGRLFTEMGDHPTAGGYYKKAIQTDPTHILALHNLGLLTYFEKKNLDEAQGYLEQALAVDSVLPMCNYVLGEIALDKKDYARARYRFYQEIVVFNTIQKNPKKLPANRGSLLYALKMANQQLVGLYSSHYPDKEKAQVHLQNYLKLEPDPKARAAMIERIGKVWKIQTR